MGLMSIIAQHGYAAVGLILFVAAAGLPVPTSVVLLAAGAAAHGNLNLSLLILIAASAALLGDVLLYTGGRYTRAGGCWPACAAFP